MDKYDKALDKFIEFINYKIKRDNEMSIRKLSDILQMNHVTLRNYLSKKRKIDIKTAFKIADHYNIDINSFIFGDCDISIHSNINEIKVSITTKTDNSNKKLIKYLEDFKKTIE